MAAALADPVSEVRRRACEVAVTHPAVDLGSSWPTPSPWWSRLPPGPSGNGAAATADLATPVVDGLVGVAGAHDDPLCREAAVAALGAIGDVRGLPAILAAMSDKPAVRRRAVIALTPFDGPEVDAALNRARTDRDWQVRQAAEDLRRLTAAG